MIKMRLSCVFAVVWLLLIAPQYARAQAVVVHGDVPTTGFCNVSFAPSRNMQLFSNQCNDQTTGIDVPFGMSATLCDNPYDNNRGDCRHFLPGHYQVDDRFNDHASSIWVERQMIGYVGSGDFPTDVTVAITIGGDPSNFHPKPGLMTTSSGDYVVQGYAVPVPASCVQPHLAETTKANDAHWKATWTPGQNLEVVLWAKYKHLFGSNNWIGVKLTCLPATNGETKWGG